VIVGVTGTRDGLTDAQHVAALQLVKGTEIEEFHFGDCVGVDTQMMYVVVSSGATPHLHIWPADVADKWKTRSWNWLADNYRGLFTVHPKAKPFVRNTSIVEAVERLWGFPGTGASRGTWDTINKMAERQKARVVVSPDGKLDEYADPF
jgi:hypothetical protein